MKLFSRDLAILKTNDLNRSHLLKNLGDKLFGLLISSVKEYAIFMIDPEGIILTWNKGAETIKGYREEEVIGKPISIFYTPEEIEANEPEQNLREALALGSFEREGWRVRRDGSKFWANIVFTPLLNDDGQLLGFAKVTRDMTDRKFSEDLKEAQKAELQQRVITNTETIIKNEMRYHALVESINDGVALLDENFKSIYRSSSAERIAGWRNDEFSSIQIAELIHPEDLSAAIAIFARVNEQPGIPIDFTYRLMHKGGWYIWLSGTFTNMLHDDAIKGIVCNFRDVTDKKVAEDELRRTVRELSDYKYALDQSAIVSITDENGIIEHVNQNFCAISKYHVEELVGKNHRIANSIFHSDAFIKNLWDTISAGKIWKGDSKYRAADGSIYWVVSTIVPFLDEKGKVYQYLEICTDITERKLSREKLAESERLIKAVTDNIPGMIAFWSADLTCLFANKTTLNFLGKRYDQMIGSSGRALLDSGLPGTEILRLHTEKVLQGEEQIFDYNTAGVPGKRKYYKLHYVPDMQDGAVNGYYSFTYDITDIREAEELIKSKTEQIENILERITDGFMALDKNLCFTYVNKQFGEMTANSPADLVGKYIWDMFPERSVEVATGFDQAINEQRYVTLEDYYEPLDLWAENHLYPSEGGVSAFIRDITVRKRAEREIHLLNERLELKVIERTAQLEAANRELEAFSYSVSHDLRTPLRAVNGFSAMLKDDFDTMQPADRQRIVDIIVNNARLMGQLIDDLLEFSRLGRKEMHASAVNMNAMVAGCINELTFNNTKIYKFKIKDLPQCQGDTSMIKQVWMNLLGNAIKYSSKVDKPIIEVRAKIDGQNLTYFIKDNGVGFDMKYADKLFSVFQRLHRKDEFEGTGVGLALVKRVIDRHGGKLQVKAQPGKGAVFSFTLPIKQELSMLTEQRK